MTASYSVYLVRCRDGSIYTGIATDVTRRIEEHETGVRGAKYLRGRGPLELLYEREIGDRSLASRIETRVKRLGSGEKADIGIVAERIDALLDEFGTAEDQ